MKYLKYFFFYLCHYSLHDGGFKDIVEDNEPHPPKWVHWMAKIPEYVINPDMKYLG